MSDKQSKEIPKVISELTAVERQLTEQMKVPADHPEAGLNAEQIARKGIKRPEPGGIKKEENWQRPTTRERDPHHGKV